MVQPLGSYVVVVPENQFLSKDNLQKAIVSYVGRGHRLPLLGGFQPLTVKAGDSVVFPPSKLVQWKEGKDVYYIIREEDIIMVL